jgi:hypothetical protein
MLSEARLAVLLATLLLMSGCAGLLPTDGSAAEGPTPSGTRSYDEAVDGHSESLLGSGRFKLRWVRGVQFTGQVINRTPQVTEVVVDFNAERYLLGRELAGQNGIYQSGLRFQEGTTNWQLRELDNGSTVYRRMPPEYPFSIRNYTLARIRAMENFTTQFPLERNGTTVFQGQPVTRYTAEELGSADRCLFESRYVIQNVTAIEVVALVDEQGVIRQFDCTLSGDTITGESFREHRRWTITGIGVVEVRQPDPLVNETPAG